jgi:hypothetical protein
MAKCGQQCQVWSRVCGYHRPYIMEGNNPDGTRKSSYNPGKRSEAIDRKPYVVPGSASLAPQQRVA